MHPLSPRFARLLWRATLCAAVATIALAVWAVYELPRIDPIFIGSPFRLAMQVLGFTLPTRLLHEVPPSVYLARAALAALGLLALATLALPLIRRPWSVIAASRSQGHVVLCGAGADLSQVADDLLRDGGRVVVIRGGASAATWQHSEAIQLEGDATDASVLAAAGVARARAVIVLGAEDDRNMSIGQAVDGLAARRRPAELDPLLCVVEVRDDDLRHGLEATASTEAGRRVELRPFCRERAIVRRLLRDHPLDLGVDVAAGQRIHALIVFGGAVRDEVHPGRGYRGTVGHHLLLEILQRAHYDEHGPRVVLLDPDPRRLRKVLDDRYPNLGQIGSVEVRALDEEAPRSSFAAALADGANYTSIHLCADEVTRSMRALAALQFAAREADVTLPAVYVYDPNHEPGPPPPAEGSPQVAPTQPIAFGGRRATLTRSTLLDDELDRLARAVHEDYLDECAAQGQTPASKPAMMPWRELAESYRDANRRQADHIEIKLRAIGCHSTSEPAEEAFEFRDDEVEILARLEHLRWMAERMLQGWTWGEPRDDARRRHPALVPYEQLTEELKNYDRSAVRNIPALLARAGRSIRRGGAASGAGT